MVNAIDADIKVNAKFAMSQASSLKAELSEYSGIQNSVRVFSICPAGYCTTADDLFAHMCEVRRRALSG